MSFVVLQFEGRWDGEVGDEGLDFEGCDAVLVDKLDQYPYPQVETCNWCPDGPLVRHHPRGQVPHIP